LKRERTPFELIDLQFSTAVLDLVIATGAEHGFVIAAAELAAVGPARVGTAIVGCRRHDAAGLEWFVVIDRFS
jgi:hypothetical protein